VLFFDYLISNYKSLIVFEFVFLHHREKRKDISKVSSVPEVEYPITNFLPQRKEENVFAQRIV